MQLSDHAQCCFSLVIVSNHTVKTTSILTLVIIVSESKMADDIDIEEHDVMGLACKVYQNVSTYEDYASGGNLIFSPYFVDCTVQAMVPRVLELP